MPVTETTARQWIVAAPPTAQGKSPTTLVKVSTTENTKAVAVQIDRSLKDSGNGIVLPVEIARDLGNALVKAADMAGAPFGPQPPTPTAPAQ